ncbi:MAG: KH domain-containing protein [Proteobacteria bacterium]|nr:KH domain-containing protein [Pseudomonadota bacterium]
MQELLACIECAAKGLVDNPDAVNVSVSEDGMIYLSVAEDDLGKVIGKSGRTIDALRAILSAAASRIHVTCRLEIVENG